MCVSYDICMYVLYLCSFTGWDHILKTIEYSKKVASLSSFLAFLGLQSSSGFAENCVQNRISSQASPFYWVFSRMIS